MIEKTAGPPQNNNQKNLMPSDAAGRAAAQAWKKTKEVAPQIK